MANLKFHYIQQFSALHYSKIFLDCFLQDLKHEKL